MSSYGSGLANALTRGAVAYGDQEESNRREALAEQARRDQLQLLQERLKLEKLKSGIVPESTSMEPTSQGTVELPAIKPISPMQQGSPVSPTSEAPHIDPNAGGMDATLARKPGVHITPSQTPLAPPPLTFDRPGLPQKVTTPEHYDASKDPNAERAELRAIITAMLAMQRDNANNQARAERNDATNDTRKGIAAGNNTARGALAGVKHQYTLSEIDRRSAGALERVMKNPAYATYQKPLETFVDAGLSAIASNYGGKLPTNVKQSELLATTRNALAADPTFGPKLRSGEITDDMIRASVQKHAEGHKRTTSDARVQIIDSVLGGDDGEAIDPTNDEIDAALNDPGVKKAGYSTEAIQAFARAQRAKQKKSGGK